MKNLLFLPLLLWALASQSQVVVNVSPNNTDDKAQLQSAVDAGKGAFTIVNLAAGTFKLSGQVQGHYSNVWVKADSTVTTFTLNSGYPVGSPVFKFAGVVTTYTAQTVTITGGRNYFRWGNTTGLASVDTTKLIKIKASTTFTTPTNTYSLGAIGRSIRKAGDTVFLDHTIDDSYDVNEVAVITPLKNIRVEGIRLNLNNTALDGIYGFEFTRCYKFSIRKCVVNSVPNSTLGCKQAIVVNESDSGDVSDNRFYDIKPTLNASSNYTVNAQGWNLFLHHNRFDRVNIGIESGSTNYVSRIKVWHNTVNAPLAHNAYGMHGNSEGDIGYNISYGSQPVASLQPRRMHLRIHHNYMDMTNADNTTRLVIWLYEQAFNDVLIDSNWAVFHSAGSSANNIFVRMSQLSSSQSKTRIKNNKVWGGDMGFANSPYASDTLSGNISYTYGGVTGTFSAAATGLYVNGNTAGGSVAPPGDTIVHCPYETDTATYQPPTPPATYLVNAGRDTVYFKNQTRPDTLYLDGSKSTGVTAYAWTQLTGPTTLTLHNSTAAKSYATGTVTTGGTYSFRLSINGGVAKDTVLSFVRDWQKKNETACRTGYDTTLKKGGKLFVIQPTESRNGGLSVGWNIPYFNRTNFISTHGYAGQTIQGGDTLAFPGTDSAYLFNIGDFGGTAGCPVYVVPQTKPIVFRSAKWVVGQDQALDTNVVNHVIFDGTALRSKGIGFGFQIDHVTVPHANTYNSFGGGWVTDFTLKGFWNQKVATLQIKLDGDSLRAWKQYDKFVQKNITISDFIIDGSAGEAMYLGNTDPAGTKQYNHYTAPQRMSHVVVKDGIVLNSQNDGIQFSNARDNGLALNNLVFNAGTANTANQRTGIEMGGNTQGDILRNIVLRTTGAALDNLGYGDATDAQNIIDSVYDGFTDLNGSAGLYQKSIFSTTDYEFGDSALKATTTGNVFARVFTSSRYIKTANNGGDRVQRIGSISGNIFVHPTATTVSSLIENGTSAVVGTNTIKTSFPVAYMGYKVIPSGYQFTIQQGDSSRTFTAVDDAVTWLLARANGTTVTPNTLPTANAGATQHITLPVASVTLTGTGSDAEGAVTYLWTRDSGPDTVTIATPNAATTNVFGLMQGSYVFRLTVTDKNGAIASDTATVIVHPQPVNQLPTANAGVTQTITLPLDSAALIGSGSDFDGTIASYKWVQDKGPNTALIRTPLAATTEVAGLIQGSYVFKLTVTDNTGGINSDTATVIVNGPATPPTNSLPTADAGVDKTITLPTNAVTTTGTGTDLDGTISSYVWTQQRGTNTATITQGAGGAVTFKFNTSGTWVFKLVVTDNGGGQAADSMTVTVNPAPANTLPTANAGVDKTITLPTKTVSTTGTGNDPDGTITKYAWAQVSGTNAATITPGTAGDVTFSFSTSGTWTFRLTVTDNQGGQAFDTMTVTVNPKPKGRHTTGNTLQFN
jgi:hypothetical protein